MVLVYLLVATLLETSLPCQPSLLLGEVREIDHLRLAYDVLDDLLDVALLEGQHLVYRRLRQIPTLGQLSIFEVKLLGRLVVPLGARLGQKGKRQSVTAHCLN